MGLGRGFFIDLGTGVKVRKIFNDLLDITLFEISYFSPSQRKCQFLYFVDSLEQEKPLY